MRGEDTTWYRQDVEGKSGATERNPQDLIAPPGNPVRNYYTATLPLELTTPQPYITTTFKDPFRNESSMAKDTSGGIVAQLVYSTDPTTLDYTYHNIHELFLTAKAGGGAPHGRAFDEKDLAVYGQWRLISVGPDREFWGSPGRRVYDPTNGTVTKGDIIRTQNSSAGESNETTVGDN